MFISLLLAAAIMPAKATITIQTDKPGIRISPDLYGIFFEEINCAGDGGLYAELVRNRSFEESEQPAYWTLKEEGSAKGSIVLDKGNSVSKENPTSLKLTHTEGRGKVGAANEGYWGIPLERGGEYSFSCHLRGDGTAHELLASLESSEGKVYEQTKLRVDSPYWANFSRTLKSPTADKDARLVLSLDKPGAVWIDMVSLFPAKTFKSRDNGLRTDLATKLADLRPSFMRFPGGCWVEGDSLAYSQHWKRTVGPVEDRWTQYNLWQYTSTNGLGYHEYLQLCEDIGAAPLFVINCGMSHHGNVPMNEMDSRVQDALDAIEYANGPVNSKWGGLRAKHGHPDSFHLKYLEIGNENGGPAYAERYPMIANAVKARYPDIHLIANVWGGYPKGTLTEIIDEHYYSNPNFFFDNADRYDHYDRKGPKVYVGEYAVTEGCGKGNLIAAVGEAAFMTGMERNSDVVKMCSYAPLFANVNHKTWNPDLICFDNSRSYGTPSYYVQKMFSTNRGDHVLPASVEVSGVEKRKFPDGGIAVGTWGTQAEFENISLSGADAAVVSFRPTDFRQESGNWKVDGNLLRQTGSQDGTRASLPGPQSFFELRLRARKLSGREGFLISVGSPDSKNWIWWNIGGWGNTQHALEWSTNGQKSMLGRPVPGSIETGRWYDIRIEYSPERIQCYLDNKLIHDVECPNPKPLHVVASRVDNSGEVILKVVNSSDHPIDTKLDLNGWHGAISARADVLTSGSPLDENTLEEPRKVAPTTLNVRGNDNLEFKFPPYSVTVMRVRGNPSLLRR